MALWLNVNSAPLDARIGVHRGIMDRADADLTRSSLLYYQLRELVNNVRMVVSPFGADRIIVDRQRLLFEKRLSPPL